MPLERFKPVNNDHSIVEHMVFFEFGTSLALAMPALLGLRDELSNEFPKQDLMHTVNFNIGEMGAEFQMPREPIGFRLTRTDSDGKIEWLLSVEQNQISIHCLKYTRWTEIWPLHQRLIKHLLSKINIHTPLISVGMKWIDQFIFEGNQNDYLATDIFCRDSIHLSQQSFLSGPRWHCHTGWFDSTLVSRREVLHQLNINSGFINYQETQRLAVTIDHTTQLRADNSQDLAAFAPSGKEPLAALSGLMEALHNGNKDLLRTLLTDSSLADVGLHGERSA